MEGYAQAARIAGCPRDQLENFIRAGIALQPKQLEVSALARLCDKDDGPTDIGYGGARGPGKSHWLLAQIGADDCMRYPGLKALVLRKVGKAAKESFQDLRPKIFGQIPHEFWPSSMTLDYPNGSKIIVGNFKDEKDIDKYLGLEYDVIGIEEATQLTKQKIDMIQSVNRTSKPGWRPRMYYTTNPGGIGHAWFRKMFILPARDANGGSTRFVQALVHDNKFVNKDYLKRLEGLTGWQRRAWLHGDWDIAAGQYFTTFSREHHVKAAPERIPGNWTIWGALDYGFTHYTVFYLMAEDGDGNVWVLDEHGEQKWIVERHAAAIHEMCSRYGFGVGRLEQIVAGHDAFSVRPGPTVSQQYADAQIHLSKANNDRISGAARILQLLGDPLENMPPRLFISPKCTQLIESLPLLEHNPMRPEDVRKINTDEEGNGGDDFYDAFRYGVMASRAASFAFSYA
jgi:phage terminase large subunit